MMTDLDFNKETDHITSVTLDPNTIISIDPDEVHERRIAIFDLLEENAFKPARVKATGPFALHISIVGNYVVFDVRHPESFEPIAAHYLSLSPFRGLIRDYFRVRDSYYEAIRSASTLHIEAVDMGRRGLHNDAAEVLRQRLTNKLNMDMNTARRLFTLLCAIQPYATRIDERDSQLPTILFVCSMNSVRSPMAAALARYLFPGKLIARSAGARSGKADGFVHAAMEELGIDMSVHTPHTLSELVATKFDLVVTLSDEARQAVDRRALDAGEIEHWDTEDPTLVQGSRQARLAAYHQLRDGLKKRIGQRVQALISKGSQPG
jgi:uncharacterized protein (UPF0262 family)/protein-tyrosine-phosphatase